MVNNREQKVLTSKGATPLDAGGIERFEFLARQVEQNVRRLNKALAKASAEGINVSISAVEPAATFNFDDDGEIFNLETLPPVIYARCWVEAVETERTGGTVTTRRTQLEVAKDVDAELLSDEEYRA